MREKEKNLEFPQKLWKQEKIIVYQEILKQGMKLNYVPNSTSLSHCLQTLQCDIVVLLLSMIRDSPISCLFYLSLLCGERERVCLQYCKKKMSLEWSDLGM